MGILWQDHLSDARQRVAEAFPRRRRALRCVMDRTRFETLVAEALDEIPEPFQIYVARVAVVIEDEPSAALLGELDMDPRRDTLFGLYEGTPVGERLLDETALLPD